MEGLLRKYKLSKLLGDNKLTEKELYICTELDKSIKNLFKIDKSKYDLSHDNSEYFMINKNKITVMIQYDNKILKVNDMFLEYLHLSNTDTKTLIKDWVTDIYGLEITDIFRSEINSWGWLNDRIRKKNNNITWKHY